MMVGDGARGEAAFPNPPRGVYRGEQGLRWAFLPLESEVANWGMVGAGVWV